jgi:hypothetical protein
MPPARAQGAQRPRYDPRLPGPRPVAPASSAGMPHNSPLPSAAISRRHALRRLLVLAASAAVGTLAATHGAAARADVVVVKSAELRAEDDDFVLNADFELTINATLEEALQRGVPLYFLLELEISRPRWYWFDDRVLSSSVQYRITWNALTRQYRVSSGLFGQTLYTLEEVERFLSRVTSRPVARRDQLQSGARYDAALRLRLDTNQLPKPFQVDALASREWSLQSDWHRWSFTA